MVLRRVVLPAPFGPTKATISPGRISALMPCNISIRPYPDTICSMASSGADVFVLVRAAKISLLHVLVLANFAWTSLEEQSAAMQDYDVVRERHHKVHVVLDYYNHSIRVTQAQEPIPQFGGFRMV